MVKLTLTLFLLFSVSLAPSSAQTSAEEPAKEEYQLKRKEFLQKYAHDDTTAALVNLFYKKRSNGISSVVALPLPAIAALGGLALHSATNPDFSLTPVWILLMGYTGTIVMIPFTMVGLYQLDYYSRKNLYLLIQDYNAGKPLPKKIKRKLRWHFNAPLLRGK